MDRKWEEIIQENVGNVGNMYVSEHKIEKRKCLKHADSIKSTCNFYFDNESSRETKKYCEKF